MDVNILKVEIGKYDSYTEALDSMIAQGVTHIGWLNAGIEIPTGNYERVFKNWSGSSTLNCDVIKRIAYSVDMGD